MHPPSGQAVGNVLVLVPGSVVVGGITLVVAAFESELDPVRVHSASDSSSVNETLFVFVRVTSSVMDRVSSAVVVCGTESDSVKGVDTETVSVYVLIRVSMGNVNVGDRVKERPETVPSSVMYAVIVSVVETDSDAKADSVHVSVDVKLSESDDEGFCVEEEDLDDVKLTARVTDILRDISRERKGFERVPGGL